MSFDFCLHVLILLSMQFDGEMVVYGQLDGGYPQKLHLRFIDAVQLKNVLRFVCEPKRTIALQFVSEAR